MGILLNYFKSSLMNHIDNLKKLTPLKENWEWHRDQIRDLQKIDKKLMSDLKKAHKEFMQNDGLYEEAKKELVRLKDELEGILIRKNVNINDQAKEANAINKVLDHIYDLLNESLISNRLKLNKEGNKAICVPGCYLCCSSTEKQGIAVRRQELNKIREDVEKYNIKNKTHLEITEPPEAELSRTKGKFYKTGFNYTLPSIEITDNLYILYFIGEYNLWNSLNLCSFLKDHKKETWAGLCKAYNVDLPYKEGFKGKYCDFYLSRPIECRRQGCNYSSTYLPRAIKKTDGRILKELLIEKDLIKRFQIIDRYLNSK